MLALIRALIACLFQRGEYLFEVQCLRDSDDIDILIEVVFLITIQDRRDITGSINRGSVTL